jgi:hypothetical protein
MSQSEQVSEVSPKGERRHPLDFDRPRVRGGDHTAEWVKHKEWRRLVATVCLGFTDIRDYGRGDMRGIEGVHRERQSRVNVPRFDDLDDAWRVMNWFSTRQTSSPASRRFFALLLTSGDGATVRFNEDPSALRKRIMDAAITALVEAERRGEL